MRDIIFLESMQDSIKDWQNDYVNLSNGQQIILSDTYDKARDICETYSKYIKKYDADSNPFLNTMLVTYGNSSFDFKDAITSAIEGMPDKIINGDPILTWRDGVSFTIDVLKALLRHMLITTYQPVSKTHSIFCLMF